MTPAENAAEREELRRRIARLRRRIESHARGAEAGALPAVVSLVRKVTPVGRLTTLWNAADLGWRVMKSPEFSRTLARLRHLLRRKSKQEPDSTDQEMPS